MRSMELHIILCEGLEFNHPSFRRSDFDAFNTRTVLLSFRSIFETLGLHTSEIMWSRLFVFNEKQAVIRLVVTRLAAPATEVNQAQSSFVFPTKNSWSASASLEPHPLRTKSSLSRTIDFLSFFDLFVSRIRYALGLKPCTVSESVQVQRQHFWVGS